MQIFIYFNVYRLISPRENLLNATETLVTLFYSTNILMVPCAVIFAGQRLKSKQSELLVQLKKTMNGCRNQKLLNELETFAGKLQGQPIVASCGFFTPDLIFLSGVGFGRHQMFNNSDVLIPFLFSDDCFCHQLFGDCYPV
jgi:hypothetical protein